MKHLVVAVVHQCNYPIRNDVDDYDGDDGNENFAIP